MSGPGRYKKTSACYSGTVPRIFVSYRHTNIPIVRRVHKQLSAAYGQDNVFAAVSSLEPGNRYGSEIESALICADLFLALIEPGRRRTGSLPRPTGGTPGRRAEPHAGRPKASGQPMWPGRSRRPRVKPDR